MRAVNVVEGVIEPFLLTSDPQAVLGELAIATGAVGLAALLMAMLSFAFGRTFGRIHDLLAGLAAILTVGLAMLFFPEHRAVEPQLASIAFGIAVLGGFIAAFGSVLAATEAESWFRAQLYVAAGYALIGFWLIMLNISGGAAHVLPNRAVSMGILAGWVMALGIAAIPGILGSSESEQSEPWISRYVGRAGYLGWLVLYPIWCLWLGQSRLHI